VLAVASPAEPLPRIPTLTTTVSAVAARVASATSTRSCDATVPSTKALVLPCTPAVGLTLVISTKPTPVRSRSDLALAS